MSIPFSQSETMENALECSKPVPRRTYRISKNPNFICLCHDMTSTTESSPSLGVGLVVPVVAVVLGQVVLGPAGDLDHPT